MQLVSLPISESTARTSSWIQTSAVVLPHFLPCGPLWQASGTLLQIYLFADCEVQFAQTTAGYTTVFFQMNGACPPYVGLRTLIAGPSNDSSLNSWKASPNPLQTLEFTQAGRRPQILLLENVQSVWLHTRLQFFAFGSSSVPGT